MAGQGKTNKIFAEGASVFYSTDLHEQEASVYAHESVEEIKLLRWNAKRRHAFLIKKKIKPICEERGSRSELRVNRGRFPRRNIATERSTELQVAGRRYGRVQQEIDDRVSECFRMISDYSQSHLEDEESAASVRSRLVDNRSQTSRASSTSQSPLQEATERLDIARLELQQSEQRLRLLNHKPLEKMKSSQSSRPVQ